LRHNYGLSPIESDAVVLSPEIFFHFLLFNTGLHPGFRHSSGRILSEVAETCGRQLPSPVPYWDFYLDLGGFIRGVGEWIPQGTILRAVFVSGIGPCLATCLSRFGEKSQFCVVQDCQV